MAGVKSLNGALHMACQFRKCVTCRLDEWVTYLPVLRIKIKLELWRDFAGRRLRQG
jgi:hypothetical protein